MAAPPHAPAQQGSVSHQVVSPPHGEVPRGQVPQGLGEVSRGVVGVEVAAIARAQAVLAWGLLASTSPGQDPRFPALLAVEGAVGVVECHQEEEYRRAVEAGQRWWNRRKTLWERHIPPLKGSVDDSLWDLPLDSPEGFVKHFHGNSSQGFPADFSVD